VRNPKSPDVEETPSYIGDEHDLWKVLDMLGHGTFGYVVKAQNFLFKGGEEMAIKIPRGDSTLDGEFAIWKTLEQADPERKQYVDGFRCSCYDKGKLTPFNFRSLNYPCGSLLHGRRLCIVFPKLAMSLSKIISDPKWDLLSNAQVMQIFEDGVRTMKCRRCALLNCFAFNPRVLQFYTIRIMNIWILKLIMY
jgi:hypothetical protein